MNEPKRVLVDCCALAPSLHGAWAAWAFTIAGALSGAPDWDVALAYCPDDAALLHPVVPEALRGRMTAVDGRGALAALASEGRIPRGWTQDGVASALSALLRTLAGVRDEWSPAVVISPRPGGLARALWPEARLVSIELAPFARPPFPNLFHLAISGPLPRLGAHDVIVGARPRPCAESPAELLAAVRAATHDALDALDAVEPLDAVGAPIVCALTGRLGYRELIDDRDAFGPAQALSLASRLGANAETILTQHPTDALLPPNVLASLSELWPGVQPADPGGVVPATNRLARRAEVLATLGGKSPFLGLLFQTAVIEAGPPALGALSTPDHADMAACLERARMQARDPIIRGRREAALHDLLRWRSIPHAALADPRFLGARLASLLDPEGEIHPCDDPWGGRDACAQAFQASAKGMIASLNGGPLADGSADRATGLDPSLYAPQASVRPDGWVVFDGLRQRATAPALAAAARGARFGLFVAGAAHPYVCVFAIGDDSASPLRNRRLALHWVRESAALALSASDPLHGVVSIETPAGSVPAGRAVEVVVWLDPQAAVMGIALDGRVAARGWFEPALRAPGVRWAFNADLEWDGPMGDFALRDFALVG
jgi:hypothetical protein